MRKSCLAAALSLLVGPAAAFAQPEQPPPTNDDDMNGNLGEPMMQQQGGAAQTQAPAPAAQPGEAAPGGTPVAPVTEPATATTVEPTAVQRESAIGGGALPAEGGSGF